MITSIWMSGSGWPVRIALTSYTSPTLTPRKVTALPLSRPLTDPGKYRAKRSRRANHAPELRPTMATRRTTSAPRMKTPTARGCVRALTAGPG